VLLAIRCVLARNENPPKIVCMSRDAAHRTVYEVIMGNKRQVFQPLTIFLLSFMLEQKTALHVVEF